MLTGTIVNALAVLAGSVAGLLLTQLAQRFSRFLPAGSVSMGERLQTIIMQGVALCVIFIGISGSFKGSNTLISILSMVIGAIIGERGAVSRLHPRLPLLSGGVCLPSRAQPLGGAAARLRR